MGGLGGPIWLDVTRTLSRVGRGVPSGIDRVERAYLRHLLEANSSARFLCRTTRGYLLLDATGARRLDAMAGGSEPPGRADLISILTGRGAAPRHRAEATLRPLAIDRCRPSALAALVARQGGVGRYLNVGHASLEAQTLGAFPPSAIVVFIHDLIPILHPGLVPPDQPARFARRLAAVRRHAGHALANSSDTSAALSRHWGSGAPPISVATLGIEGGARPKVRKDPASVAMVGTIEPRKNHAVILRAWEILARDRRDPEMPHLHIVGAPGWQGTRIRETVAAHPLAGRCITLHGPLGDAALSELLDRCGLLAHPSLAEGFGLPPHEALRHHVRPICSDLPALREGLGGCAVYVDPTDAYAWAETIGKHLAGKLDGPEIGWRGPTWADHFDTVAAALCGDPGRVARKD